MQQWRDRYSDMIKSIIDMKAVDIRLDYLKTVNYVMFHNRIPVCKSIEVAGAPDKPCGENVRMLT